MTKTYEVTEEGVVTNIRPLGAEIDLSYYHPEWEVSATVFMPAKEAADKLFDMLRNARTVGEGTKRSFAGLYEYEQHVVDLFRG